MQPPVAEAESKQSDANASKSSAITQITGLPLAFEPNRGQIDPSVEFVAKGGQYTLFLTASDAVFVLPKHLEIPSSIKSVAMQTSERKTREPSTWTSIAMRLVGARSSVHLSASDQLPGVKNYYIGRDQTKWVRSVPLYSQLQARDVYPGIDIAYCGIGSQLEFDFLINPGADPRQIRLAFKGDGNVHIDSSGNLLLSGTAGNLKIHRPFAYQEMLDGTLQPIGAKFARSRNGEIRLSLGTYDHRRQLIIDPSVTYATYLGGSGLDEGLGVAIDESGNTYVTGATASPDFPNTGGGLNYVGGLDVFVTAFNSNGELVFSTLVGGSADDVGTSVAWSPNGIFVTGYTTSADFPADTNFCFASCSPIQLLTLCGTQNAFVFTLLPNGEFQLAASVYLGGSGSDTGLGITVDTAYGEGAGYIYVAGQTTSPDFASCYPPSNETQINMGHGTGPSDGFVSKIAQSFGALWFSTFLGGSNSDFATGIALDNPGSTENHIYITGGTISPDFYTTPGVLQPTCGTDGNCNNGQDDAFVTVLCTYQEAPCNASGLMPNYVYSTFVGGSRKDDAYSIAADPNGNSYIAGQTSSPDFKLQNPFQATLKGAQNAFVSKLNSAGSGLLFSTYLGGSQMDAGLGLAIDTVGDVYVTGRTNSPDFPLQSPTQSTIGGRNDAFVSDFLPTGNALSFSTFLGGSGDEDVLGGSIAVDSLLNVYVTGDTNSTNFPTQNPYQGTIGSTENCTINGNQVLCPDAFVAKFNAQTSGFATLSVTVYGGPSGASGSVSSVPPGIDDCSDGINNPETCTADFESGSTVTLTATPDGSQFLGWSGNVPPSCGMNVICQIQINGNTSVTATFGSVSQLYSLQVQGAGIGSGTGNGTITSLPAGINCGEVCMFDFAPGTQVTLTAMPDSGSYFYGWSMNPACSGNGQCVILMNSNQTVDYTFLANNAPPPQSDFTLTISPSSLGTVSVGSQGVASIAITTSNGFNDMVNLTCSVSPASASSPSCSVNPSSLEIPVNGAGSATLAVNTTGLTAAKHGHISVVFGLWLPFLGLFGSGARSGYSRQMRNCLRVLFCLSVLSAMAFQLACGSSGGGISGGVAQPGNYTVTVTAQGETTMIIHSSQVTITVQ